MPQLKTYDLFLSHVWRSAENSEYYRLENLLREASYFSWRNYSVPEHDPLGTKSNGELRHALHLQIAPINCFLVVSGMYVNHRKWIQEEIFASVAFIARRVPPVDHRRAQGVPTGLCA